MKEKFEGTETFETFVYEDEDFKLISDIVNLQLEENELSGLYRYDSIVLLHHRSGMRTIPITTSAPFLFTKHEEETLLIITAKKNVANRVANELSKLLHGRIGAIAVSMIDPQEIEAFYRNSEATKVLLLEGLTIPNLEKLTLYGADVVQTTLHGDYINEGQPWYVVAKHLEKGYTIGLVRDGSVTIFNSVMLNEFIEFMKEDIFPLLLKRHRF